jgi:hypothetical protein
VAQACFASMKPCIQTPVSPKKEGKKAPIKINNYFLVTKSNGQFLAIALFISNIGHR